ERRHGRFIAMPQDVTPWAHTLEALLSDSQLYDRISQASREAACRFVSGISAAAFAALLTGIDGHATHRRPIHPEFAAHIARQPCDLTLDGLRLTIDKDVFPPDLGRCAANMARLAREFRPNVALDMGCGSGYLALMMKSHGAGEVWAVDIHGPAVECARKNA